MIVILYTAGNFGSTLEYCLRNFSKELKDVKMGLLANGSMHGYARELHMQTFDEFNNLDRNSVEIITGTFPTHDRHSPSETLAIWQEKFQPTDKVILVYGSNLNQIERTQLFQFHKLGKRAFFKHVLKNKAQSWNPNYTTWKDMHPYELREALSFFIDSQSYHLGVQNHVPKEWCAITPDDVLLNFESTVLALLSHCGLTYNNKDIDSFYKLWFDKQQYIINEFDQIIKILDAIKQGYYFEWNNLSILGEAILQSRLRQTGIELACFGLNVWPNTTSELQKYFLNSTSFESVSK